MTLGGAAKENLKTTVSQELLSSVARIHDQLRREVRGQDAVVELALCAWMARGHVLIEGPPGTGKTSLARAMAHALVGGSFRRVQMTSDLLPSDIVGFLRVKPGTSEFEFRKGPIFTHFLLADELNRTSSKTQSALLEAMAESTVTVDGQTHALPDPFFVIATQNPLEFNGVFPLTESQLDRFMLQLSISTPGSEEELRIYQERLGPLSAGRGAQFALDLVQARELLAQTESVFVEQSIQEYAGAIVRATRAYPGVAYGVSVRGGIQLLAASRALALVRGREFVRPKEIRDLAVPALAHRLCFADGDSNQERKAQVIRETLDRIRAPK